MRTREVCMHSTSRAFGRTAYREKETQESMPAENRSPENSNRIKPETHSGPTANDACNHTQSHVERS